MIGHHCTLLMVVLHCKRQQKRMFLPLFERDAMMTLLSSAKFDIVAAG
jgi:hypothetical protein